MDWTGGVRRRFAANKDNPTLQRQKAHFAKARATQKPSSHHSFRPDFGFATDSALGTSNHSSDRGRTYYRHPKRPRSPDADKRGLMNVKQAESVSNGSRGSIRHAPIAVEEASRRVKSFDNDDAAATPRHGHSAQEVNRARQSQIKASNRVDVSAESEQLEESRRRLLNRTDWLGLTIARPLRMRFPSRSDKDFIGKRRKIDKSVRQPRPATRRLITPLLEERLYQPAHFMSGALPTESIRIKVGTDALATLTQRSRRSQTPAYVNDRQSSTDLGCLSEESMLLNGEVDTYVPSPARPGIQHFSRPTASMAGFASSQATTNVRYVPESPGIHTRYNQSEYLDMDDRDSSLWSNGNATHRNGPALPQVSTLKMSDNGTATTSIAATIAPFKEPEGSAGHVRDISGLEDQTTSEASNEEANDDQVWRQLFHIEPHKSSHASMAAVMSFSAHETSSEKSDRPVLAGGSKPNPADRAMNTSRKEAHMANKLHSNKAHQLDRSSSLQSPTASLLQIERLAAQPSDPTIRPRPEADEDAIWRQFVIGSDDDDSEPSLHFEVFKSTGDIPSCRPGGSPSMMISGLGTSDDATLGDTLLATQSVI